MCIRDRLSTTMKTLKFYSRNQLFFIGLIFCGLLYAFYDKNEKNRIYNDGIAMEKTVINNSCRPYSKLSSSIAIVHNLSLIHI